MGITADEILGNVRRDMLAIAARPENLKNDHWRRAIARNLRALADKLEGGEVPDPFPVFRHESADDKLGATIYDIVAGCWVQLPKGWRESENGDVIAPNGLEFGVTGPDGRWAIYTREDRRRHFKGLVNAAKAAAEAGRLGDGALAADPDKPRLPRLIGRA
jgi:hypothetical protein